MEPAVRAVELSKHYDVYRRPADRLVELLTGRAQHVVFPALESVTFDVAVGESVGIIGQNGAGKSTLLKLLCGITRPSSGILEKRGKIASILELGTGFHPEFSGRDNAALNAAILGVGSDELHDRLPAILEFSELGSFVDRPVKTYSSGMYMRLAFSVAVNVDPDILVIDEALAVGDGHFQKKCVDRIRQFQEEGKTILFCSHAMYYVSTLCRRTLWLDHGRVMRFGPSLDVIQEYESFLLQRDREHPAAETAVALPTRSPVRIRNVDVLGADGRPRDRFETGDKVNVRLHIEADDASQPIHVLVGVHRGADDLQCFAVSTHADGLDPLTGQRSYEVTVSLDDLPLLRGEYAILAYVGDESAIAVFDRFDVRPAFSISGDRFEVGLISVRHQWDVTGARTAAAAGSR